MAIIRLGITLCPLCKQPIENPESCRAFPHFIEDEEDPLSPYSDAAFHKWCFDSWPKRNEFLERFRVFEQSMK